VLWAILGTTNDGGGWGKGDWKDFINSTGAEWKNWFGDRIVKIAIMMWLGTFVQFIISMQMWNMLKSIKETLGLDDKGKPRNIAYKQEGKEKAKNN
jgi:hypothetical protein